jgi:hypothetical protein
MAMLTVLFIVAAITVISMGYLYRADMALASCQNFATRSQTDYHAWAGLEHARAAVLTLAGANPTADTNQYSLDSGEVKHYYTVAIAVPSTDVTDPNNPFYTYAVTSRAYSTQVSAIDPMTTLSAQVVYYPSYEVATFKTITKIVP